MTNEPDFAIYRSSNHDVLAAWINYNEEYERWRLAWLEQVEAWGFDKEKNKPYVTNSAWGSATLIGVSWRPEKYNGPLPTYWKRPSEYKTSNVIEPYWSKPKGDPQIQAEFKKLRTIPDIRRDLVALGMPHHMFLGLSVTTYALIAKTSDCEFADPEIWVKWRGTDPLASDQWWDKVKLTEYYAMVESGKDPFAKDESETNED